MPQLANAGTPQQFAPQPSPAQGTISNAPNISPPNNTLSKAQVTQIIQNAPQGVQPTDIVNALVNKGYQLEGYNQPQPGQLQNTGHFFGNVINSGANFIGGAAQAVGNVFNPNPQQNTLVNLGRGVLGVGEQALNTVAGTNFNDQNTQTAAGIENYFNNRYGISDLASGNVQGAAQKILNTLYTDPVGAAADLSVLLDGGGSALGAVGKASDVAEGARLMDSGANLADVSAAQGASAASKVGNVMKTTGDFANPVSLAGKGISAAGKDIGNVAAGVLGNTSGIGFGTAKKFLTGNEAATQAMRSGEVTEEGLVDSMQNAYRNLRKTQLNDYRSTVSDISSKYPDLAPGKEVATETGDISNGVFSQSDIKNMFTTRVQDFGGSVDKDGELTFKNSSLPLDEQAQAIKMYEQVKDWSDLSPQGINNLENLIDGYYSKSLSGNFKRFVVGMDNDMKTYLRNKITEFEEADANYAKISQLMNRVKKELNVGGNAQPQTILNKVLKVANNDEDMRNALLKEMSRVSRKDIEALAAGIKAHNVMPGGIFSKGMELFGLIHPHLIGPLLATSPRISAEFLRAIGITGSKLQELTSALKLNHIVPVAARTQAAISSPKKSIKVRLPSH